MVLSVSLPWDLPGVTSENRWWLREKILLHAGLGRTTKQVKQIKRGLKDTGVSELFSSGPDTVPILFPRATETEITSQMILDEIIWPREEDVDEDVLTLEDQCRVLGCFPEVYRNWVLLKSLLSFWTGWDVLPPSLEVEVVDCDLPQSSTGFLTLKLSKNTANYEDFHRDLMASISSSYSGFDLIHWKKDLVDLAVSALPLQIVAGEAEPQEL
ncbi:uncharacterized protein LOC118803383 [Colossoma macropomum]|uniref:uncharacterized protein LOC118803383 n=1 Tax=Colossoma macropomum TaxID=42526 RepID=UPI001864BD93|nr:uncharacterized protein LOC118803383 [Colossoma macropomum]